MYHDLYLLILFHFPAVLSALLLHHNQVLDHCAAAYLSHTYTLPILRA